MTGMKKQDKIQKVMHEFKAGSLKSSSGQKVKDRKQAVAIAMSEAARMRSGGSVDKPLYERPRPAGLKAKSMTPTEKAKATKIAKASSDKKVGLYARINAMRKD